MPCQPACPAYMWEVEVSIFLLYGVYNSSSVPWRGGGLLSLYMLSRSQQWSICLACLAYAPCLARHARSMGGSGVSPWGAALYVLISGRWGMGLEWMPPFSAAMPSAISLCIYVSHVPQVAAALYAACYGRWDLNLSCLPNLALLPAYIYTISLMLSNLLPLALIPACPATLWSGVPCLLESY